MRSYSSKTNTCWYAFDLEASPPATGASSRTVPDSRRLVREVDGYAARLHALNPDTDTHIAANKLVPVEPGSNYGNARHLES